MTLDLHGPGAPYTLLFDDDDASGPGLPEAFRAIYGGDWRLLDPADERPYIYTNFVVSHDGRISFDEPGQSSGAPVSLNAPHDTWLMALLRSRADAILTGAGTLRAALRHRWTHWAPFPADRGAFDALRAIEGRAPLPLFVVITGSGDLPASAAALRVPGQQTLIATTAAGAERARAVLDGLPHLSYHISPGERVDLAGLARHLRQQGVRTLLSEGGAHIYGALIAAGLIDEVFTTSSPVIIGNRAAPARARPSLVEGVAFAPGAAPRLRLVSLRRHGDYLFQRARLSAVPPPPGK
ncbi:MAG: RibD family protein [Oscillochloridaceae bacterium]|nr:RibD family protein [Chloroflexaceae bacterium]MDW8390478.1 RibD family protein [Oscillochloridaceae bacterium]